MRLHVPRRRGGLHLERWVAIALFGVFVAVFMDRTLFYQEYAEKLAMEMTVQNIRAGLRYRIADLMLANRMSEIPSLADENPTNWLAERPGNYLGEYDGAPPGAAAGNWYFDRRTKQLVYTVNNHRHFESTGGEGYSVAFRAERQSAATQGGARRGETWVSFGPVRDFRWKP
jgi:hypothetical protein